jgi:translation initiation factor IF-2
MPKIDAKNLKTRPPIVVILGHVDHGKTTLLDYIRKTNVAGKEAGMITQSIGAYEIIHNEKRITFIDTPGHEAFSKMRARGTNMADLGVLVVSAEEGVKPQTKESIDILKSSQTPFVVAINKIDSSRADIEMAKQSLLENGVELEGEGGSVSWQAISAKKGEGVKELLDLVALTAEVENLTFDPESRGEGFVIESYMDKSRGLSVSVIIKNGIIEEGNEIATPTVSGKIKLLENFLGERVKTLEPSSPALIVGFDELPKTGEEFVSGESVDLSEIQLPQKRTEIKSSSARALSGDEGEKINVILKADVTGSLEALSGIIKSLPEIKIAGESVGDVTDGDVKSASLSNATIVGFNSRVTKQADNMAKSHNVKIITSEIIYHLLKELEDIIKSAKEKESKGELEILGVFGKKSGKKQVIGGKVIKGALPKNSEFEIFRGGNSLGEGKIINLQKGKIDANEAKEGEECGLLVEAEKEILVGDKLVV